MKRNISVLKNHLINKQKKNIYYILPALESICIKVNFEYYNLMYTLRYLKLNYTT